jgi:hypothetical protein
MHDSKEGSDHHLGIRISSEYHLQPILSSSAPEREGIWHEVRRKSSERPKAVTPKATKSATPKAVTPKSDVSECLHHV